MASSVTGDQMDNMGSTVYSPLSVPSAPTPRLPQISVAPGSQLNYSYKQSAPSLDEMSNGVPPPAPTVTGEIHVGQEKKNLILCFDGTGNKFKGNAGDTNILKIFRMLDRNTGVHYYQPGIGTYITGGSLSRVHIGSRIRSWVEKAVDSAVGTSFDQHVIGGYKFLMRYYSPGDDIYMFGFSRGAYTARFLAEMLDHVGLVAQGNEEMVLFAWKTFSNWQQRQGNDKKQHMYNYMRAFRETFARPIRRVRFLGLFDTVNSVPRFEQAWLKRSKGFPYTARSTARIIRHAVGIDERRAKFRQDLVEKIDVAEIERRRSFRQASKSKDGKRKRKFRSPSPGSSPSRSNRSNGQKESSVYRDNTGSRFSTANLSVSSAGDGESMLSLNIHAENDDESDDDEAAEQDIEEVWFPGAHGDIGGGWDLPSDEEPLSHGPLVWMVREARKAGLKFDKNRMKELKCWLHEFNSDGLDSAASSPNPSGSPNPAIPAIEVSTPSTNAGSPPDSPRGIMRAIFQASRPAVSRRSTRSAASDAKEFLINSYTRGKIHDCLCFKQGLCLTGVIGWKIMEYLPFRRMDLQPDGSWKPISWPLPRGEVRDIPDNVKIHCSVLMRMETDENYRPGNLIVGGGGRGVRRAPKHMGIGEWVVVKDRGSLAGEVLMKKSAVEKLEEHESLQKYGLGLQNIEKTD